MASRLEEEPAANENGNDREDQNKEMIWEKRDSEYLLIVVTFMATVAFQAGMNPPGGVWQDDKNDNNSSNAVGTSIMATRFPSEFLTFISGVTVCMIVSMVLFLVLLNELPAKTPSVSRNLVSRIALYFALFFALGSMFMSYWSSIVALTPKSMIWQVIVFVALMLVIGCVILGILLKIQKKRSRNLGD